jgi:hypothetical protein
MRHCYSYEIPDLDCPSVETIVMPVMQRVLKKSSYMSWSSTSVQTPVGFPFVVRIRRQSTLDEVYQALWYCLKRFVTDKHVTPQQLFALKIVDSYGSTTIKDLTDYGGQIVFNERQTPLLCVEWDPLQFDRHFDEKLGMVCATLWCAAKAIVKRTGANAPLPSFITIVIVQTCSLQSATTDASANVKSTQVSSISLASCLDAFSRPETLSDMNTWYVQLSAPLSLSMPLCNQHAAYETQEHLLMMPMPLSCIAWKTSCCRYCPVCKDHKRAEKKLDIWKLPKYLVIHLKRFSFTSTFRSKIDTLVEFPLEGLDLAQYEKGNIDPSQLSSTYHLVAISVWTTRSLVSVNDSTNTHTLSRARCLCA